MAYTDVDITHFYCSKILVMKTLEQLAAETFPVGNETCPSKVLTARYNQAKMVKAVNGWLRVADESRNKSIDKKAPFPSGGVVQGPVNKAMIGDESRGEEYIIPQETLDRLNHPDVKLKDIDPTKAAQWKIK